MTRNNIYKIVLTFFLAVSVFTVKAQHFRFNQPTIEDTVIENKIYRQFANYVLISYGVGFNFRQHNSEQAGSVFYTFRFKKQPFRIGYSVVSRYFVLSRTLQKINDLVFAVGKRVETAQANFSLFAGLSYSYGTYFFYHSPTIDLDVYRAFKKPGLYLELELTKKVFYDIGIGASLFGVFNNGYSEYFSDVNHFYGAVGMKLNLYFSGAYRGEIGYN
jgi:hypothetical protein